MAASLRRLRPFLTLAAGCSLGFGQAAHNEPQPKLAWTFHTRAAAPNDYSAHIAAFEATPVLGGNLLYVITPYDQVIALDPGTGSEQWRFDPHVAADRHYSEATARGVTVSNNTVYFGTIDSRLIALSAADGKLQWQVDIAPGVKDSNYQITSPPVVSHSTVIVGSSIGDNGKAEMERGVVRGFDIATGHLKWSWDPTPSGKTGAANAWTPMSVDPTRDMVFLSTGSASPDFYGGLRPGNDLYANCVIALEASTGKLLWHFQVVHHDLWDYDVASPPVLVDFKDKPAIGVLTKIGHYFLLDRMTGAPLLPVDEKLVPPSDVKGESASLTQPVPRSGVFTLQTFTPRPGWCEAEFKKLRYEGLFTPPSLGEGTLVFPGNVGGANWGGGVYDSKRGLIFVAANRLATAVRLVPRETFDRSGHGDTGERIGVEYANQQGTPYGMSRRTFLGQDEKPCNVEPWGALAAIDVATGKLRWETPTTVSLGGPLQVGGLIIFGGDLWVNKLKAYSADNGRKLWEIPLPHAANSVPGTYLWKGRRFVVVAAGGHGKVNQDIGDDVLAFTLQ